VYLFDTETKNKLSFFANCPNSSKTKGGLNNAIED